ncbi:hypothetical protein SAMN05444008_12045 [Cnuella takakiae]|uniref:Uncharacterized protein n=1 Tax=Cnuella takakiae TaxID=1302690 RepID=A0A1M5HSV3_9BACT|nr:hypothetical protein SAMN05444008_12045 [Cnuella takakiae]
MSNTLAGKNYYLRERCFEIAFVTLAAKCRFSISDFLYEANRNAQVINFYALRSFF